MSRSSAPSLVRRVAGTALVGFLFGVAPAARADPAPNAIVVTSARTVLAEALAGSIPLPDGAIDADVIETRLLADAQAGDDLLMWNVAADTVNGVTRQPLLLPYARAGLYGSFDGSFSVATLGTMGGGFLGDSVLSPLSGEDTTVAEWLAEAGRVVVFNPVLTAVPEPGLWSALPCLLAALVLLHCRRRPSA